ncbi:GNAT family N-acetyltransferase [Niabella insulamsoli]|uniref:GNAT family N-acetyltransferase n=1 Tax=Niabella insulamsoli TaxID=3144874 RepID=UPI0031FCB3A7
MEIRKASINELAVVRQLAQEIWPSVYSSIISAAQINYMLDLFYNKETLSQDFYKPGYSFFLLNIDGNDSGFAGVEQKDDETWHLHKIYLSAATRGKGLGKILLHHVETFAKNHQAKYMTLNVNRFNKAQFFYQKCGYEILKEEDIDIGNGFFMNDFKMRKSLAP